MQKLSSEKNDYVQLSFLHRDEYLYAFVFFPY